jgi:hypothetical protein
VRTCWLTIRPYNGHFLAISRLRPGYRSAAFQAVTGH